MNFADAARPAFAALLLLMLLPEPSYAHGGVVEEDDQCVIRIGYLKAHFKIYVPAETGHREYCEDIPMRGESLFVMEYQHDGLGEAEIGLRIIENVTGKGTFARIEDVKAIGDIDAVTVAYAEPAVVPDVYLFQHRFEEDGDYIGIVSAATKGNGNHYAAVFPFEVGARSVGIWPAIVAAMLLLQLNYWFMSRRRSRPAAAAALLAVFAFAPAIASAADESFASDTGRFQVSYTSELRPIAINTMHAWILHVESAEGQPIVDATIEIAGGMPEHDHGLPTRPRVVEDLGNGDYRVAGMRFHMAGAWVIRISIDDGGQRDFVTIPLDL